MKILIVTNEYPPFLSGAGKIAYELTKLYSLVCETTVVVKKQNKMVKVEGVNFKEVTTLPKLWFLSYGWFYYKNKKLFDDADVIYLNEAAPTISAGMFFSKEHLKKSIIIAHGLEVEGVINSNKSTHRLFRLKNAYVNAVKKSKKLITLSNAMKQKLLPFFKGHEDKIDYCYLGVDTKEFFYRGFSSQFKNFSDKILVGSCSRLVYEKGYKEMADVMKKAIENKNNYTWIIAGDGRDKASIENYTKKIGIDSNVVFLGALSFDELSHFYSSIDIFMLLSNYDEVFPLVYIEAQTCGALAVGRNKGGVPEVIDNKTGLITNDDSAVVDFITSYENHNRQSVIEGVKKYDIKETFLEWRKKVEF